VIAPADENRQSGPGENRRRLYSAARLSVNQSSIWDHRLLDLGKCVFSEKLSLAGRFANRAATEMFCWNVPQSSQSFQAQNQDFLRFPQFNVDLRLRID
jgi:hypothetical protein